MGEHSKIQNLEEMIVKLPPRISHTSKYWLTFPNGIFNFKECKRQAWFEAQNLRRSQTVEDFFDDKLPSSEVSAPKNKSAQKTPGYGKLGPSKRTSDSYDAAGGFPSKPKPKSIRKDNSAWGQRRLMAA